MSKLQENNQNLRTRMEIIVYLEVSVGRCILYFVDDLGLEWEIFCG